MARETRRTDKAVERAEQAADRSEQAADRVEEAAERVVEVIGAATPTDGHATPFVTAPVDVPPAAQELYDQIDAFDDELSDLTAGGRRAWLEVYQHVPAPILRRSLAQIEAPAPGQLRNDLVRACQEAGKVGDLDLQLISKAVFPGAHDNCPRTREHPHIVRNVGHYGLTVLRNEAAMTAAAALTGPSAPAAPAAVIDPIAAAEKMLEAGKRLTPPTPAGPAQDPAAMATAILDVGQKLAAASSAQWQPVISLLTPVAGQLVQRLLSPPAPPPDPVDYLVKLRHAGLLPPVKAPGEESEGGGLLDNVDTVLELVDKLGERAGRGAERPPGLGVEAVRIIGPPLVRVLDRGVDAVNNLINYRRERLYAEGGGRLPRGPRRAPARPAPPAIDAPAAGSAQAELVAVLQAAIPWAQANDATRFPELAAALVGRVAGCGELLADLRGGRVSAAQAYDAMGALGVEVVEPLAGYVRRFLAWAMTAQAAPDTPAPPAAAPPPPPVELVTEPAAPSAAAVGLAVVGQCDRCGAEYNYRTRAELETDDSPCDAALESGACGGRIVAVAA